MPAAPGLGRAGVTGFGGVGSWRTRDRPPHLLIGHTGWDMFWLVASWAFVPAVAIIMSVTIIPEVAPSWQAAHGHGIPGVFTAQHQECGKTECAQYGPFASADGRVRLAEARLNEPGLTMRRGQAIPALYEGNAAQVFSADSSHRWLEDDLVLLAAVVALGVWVYRALAAFRRRNDPRRGRPRPAPKR